MYFLFTLLQQVDVFFQRSLELRSLSLEEDYFIVDVILLLLLLDLRVVDNGCFLFSFLLHVCLVDYLLLQHCLPVELLLDLTSYLHVFSVDIVALVLDVVDLELDGLEHVEQLVLYVVSVGHSDGEFP